VTASTFEIRPAASGYQVFSTTSGDWGIGGGLASTSIFPSEAAAISWVTQQFGVPADAWTRRADRVLVAAK
jgi:hypothetical protein